MKYIVSLMALFSTCMLYAQVVIRGPYMQSPTHESVILMWRTDVNSSTRVWYGTSPGNLSQTKIINNNVKDHVIKIDGLQPETRYYYAVGDASMILAGQTAGHFFTTHPQPGKEVPVRVWAIGDFGRGNTGQAEVKNAYMHYGDSLKTNVWLWLGDNAYNDGKDSEYQSKVFQVNGFSDVFSWLPFWPSPGNHDYGEVWSESTLLGIPYTNIPLSDHQGPYFDIVEVPRYAEAGGYPSQLEVFYSFDYGNVHFLSLNSEVWDYTFSYDGINQMLAWIHQDLQQNTRAFTIAYFHQPPYSKGSHDSDDAYELVMKAMREKVIPVLESYDIDLVVCGHSHVFERSYLIKGHYGGSSSFDQSMIMNGTNGNLSQGNPYIKDGSYGTSEGTVYVVCGNSGSSENAPSLNHPAMFYTHGGSSAMGSLVLDINKNRLDARYLKSTGEVGDAFTILKKNLQLNALNTVSICEGDSALLTASFSGGSDSLAYSWSPSAETGATAVLHPTASTTYTLTVTDLLTGQAESTSVQVNVDSMPQPSISVINGNILAASLSGYSYQWYISGNPIAGATGQYYAPVVSGSYSVKISSNNCARISDAFAYTHGTTGLELLPGVNVSLFPNPAGSEIRLQLPLLPENTSFRISDLYGNPIGEGNISAQETIFPLGHLAPGMYFMQLFTPQGNVSMPFVRE